MSLPNELLPVGLLGTGAAAAEAEGYTIERSVRFNSSDSASLSQSVSGSTTTYTASMWLKRSAVGNGQYQHFFFSGGGNGCGIGFDPADRITVYSSAHNLTDAVYRDPSAWYHILLSVNSGTATLYVNGAVAKSGVTGFEWSNTATIGRYNISAAYYFNGYIADVYLVDGQALTPSSFTETDANGIIQPVAYSGSYGTRGFHLPFSDNSSAAALGTDTSGNGNTWTVNNISVQAGNGRYITNLYTSSTSTYDGGATNTNFYNGGISTRINGFDGNLSTVVNSADVGGGWLYFRPSVALSSVTQLRVYASYVQEIRINGTVATVSPSLPATSTQWYTITSPPSTITEIAIQGHLSYSATGRFQAIEVNNIVLVDYRAGAGNDSLVDVPTNGTETDTGVGGEVRGNYATLNPLVLSSNGSLSEGNLKFNSSSNYNNARSTIGVTSGKWYAEFTLDSGLSYIGIALSQLPAASYGGNTIYGWVYHPNSYVYHNNAATSYGASFTTGDIIGLAFDADNRTAIWYKNGSSQGSYSLGSNAKAGDIFFFIGGAAVASYSSNFGQRPFAYTAPSGFKALCTANLPAPVITKPSEYMDVVTYTGNGTSQTISGLGFSPDFVWLKSRGFAYNHQLFDTIRGTGKQLLSSSTSAETTQSFSWLNAFNSNGFGVTGSAGVNLSNDPMVAWCWDAGDSTVTNNDGSITSSVRANPSAGFSVVSYSGTISGSAPSPLPTVGHGLGIAPQLVIGKSRNNGGAESGNWFVWHASAGTGNWLRLNTTGAAGSISANGGGTMVAPTSTVFSTPYISGSNISGATYIAYCFAPVEGYSAFGSYTGNGSADGPFVFTNHRPRWILLKRTDTTSNWTIIDTAREGYNVDNDPLYPNLTNAEGTTDLADILSNGFKLRSADASVNANAGTYIYASFAEQPFQYSRAR